MSPDPVSELVGRNEYVCQATVILEQIVLKKSIAIELSSAGRGVSGENGVDSRTTRMSEEKGPGRRYRSLISPAPLSRGRY